MFRYENRTDGRADGLGDLRLQRLPRGVRLVRPDLTRRSYSFWFLRRRFSRVKSNRRRRRRARRTGSDFKITSTLLLRRIEVFIRKKKKGANDTEQNKSYRVRQVRTRIWDTSCASPTTVGNDSPACRFINYIFLAVRRLRSTRRTRSGTCGARTSRYGRGRTRRRVYITRPR